ncbi:aldehyde dehydrogenase family protein [Qipengyuania qiaonensis]|uniref:Aldehyde dehydrogenase family protein n=1 Tax=Qipengyuania qiaonensis TaxID=2867240 RepID=A0ABS7J6S7_9SPHN|nr:aldehyde dehydrogenase family protein [Qipengyuania qiaonensis]MBX7483002.1 aldehyde dehydrogenase family protein [Qipengyuania qiaonensis]
MSSSKSLYDDLHLQYIGGKWRKGASGKIGENTDPFTGDKLGAIPLASKEDLDEAYAAAAKAQPAWAALPPAERAAVMERAVGIFDARHEEITHWLIREAGSTRIKAEVEWSSARAITVEAATFPHRIEGRILASDIPGKESRVYRKPLGVIGVISPWNFPLHLSQRSVAPALALGNAVVLKPASDTPVTGGQLIAKIFEEAGLPAGVLSVVIGAGSDIGDAFVEHAVPRMISFTGSTPVGKGIGTTAAGGDHLKRVALELGGNNAFVVLDDANVDGAVKAAIFGKFLHQGQICMAINRIIVDASLYDEFVDKFTTHAKTLKYGNPANADTAIGPIINAKQLEGIKDKIANAQKEGATMALGGEAEGNVLPPHVFTDVTPEMEIAREEVFGPAVSILKARDEAHALELANASLFGLSGAVHSGDSARGVAFARRMITGMTHVNDQSVNDEANAPFGGERNSGLGRFNGDWAIEEFTTDHWITVQHSPRDYPF